MIPLPIDKITEDSLKALISNGVAESRTIEYKVELPGGSDEEKREFLSDVSAFSNTSGGDIIYGMREKDSNPIELVGVESSNFDADLLRMDNILRDGINPRIIWQTQAVKLQSGRKAIVIRAPRSWNGPHRVIFRGHDKFYARSTNGKYALDVEQLRVAFVGGAAVMEKIQTFRLDRIIQISKDQSLWSAEGPLSRIVLHLIPMDAFSGAVDYDVISLKKDNHNLRPMKSHGWGARINLQGLQICSTLGSEGIQSYTQYYRTGIVEAVEARWLSGTYQNVRYFPYEGFEQEIVA
jgi:hypothetical protein